MLGGHRRKTAEVARPVHWHVDGHVQVGAWVGAGMIGRVLRPTTTDNARSSQAPTSRLSLKALTQHATEIAQLQQNHGRPCEVHACMSEGLVVVGAPAMHAAWNCEGGPPVMLSTSGKHCDMRDSIIVNSKCLVSGRSMRWAMRSGCRSAQHTMPCP